MNQACVDCGKEIKRFASTCPACKTVRCFKCWNAHYDAKVCAYGKATTIDVKLSPIGETA